MEDHPGLRELAYETLAGLGYQVLLACDGEQTVQAFQAHRDETNLALLEVMFPQLNEAEICARIHGEKPDLAVVFATGYNPDLALLQKVQEKGLPMLQKPYSLGDLARKGARNPRSPAAIGPSRIKVDTSFARMISVEHTWHRLRRRFAEAPGAEHQNSKLGVFGNKPHPPREVEASAFASRFIFFLSMCMILNG